MADELMTAGQAARFLDVSRTQIHRLVREKKLEAQRAGEFLLFERAELERYRDLPKSKGGRPKDPSLPTPIPAGRPVA